MEQNHTLAHAPGPFLVDPEKYRRRVRLVYLTITRLAFITQCTFYHNSFMNHIKHI